MVTKLLLPTNAAHVSNVHATREEFELTDIYTLAIGIAPERYAPNNAGETRRMAPDCESDNINVTVIDDRRDSALKGCRKLLLRKLSYTYLNSGQMFGGITGCGALV